MNWTPVWHQAITRPFAMGMLIGEKRTVVFRINAYADGTKMRIRFRNIYGQGRYEIPQDLCHLTPQPLHVVPVALLTEPAKAGQILANLGGRQTHGLGQGSGRDSNGTGTI